METLGTGGALGGDAPAMMVLSRFLYGVIASRLRCGGPAFAVLSPRVYTVEDLRLRRGVGPMAGYRLLPLWNKASAFAVSRVEHGCFFARSGAEK